MSSVLSISNVLKFPGQVYPFRETLEIEKMEVLDDPVSFTDVVISGEMFSADSRISIRGHITCDVTSVCARCLEDVTEPLEAEIDVQYAREVDPDDPDLYYFEGSKLDLTDAVRDGLLLVLPYRFLCKEDCLGLCPGCGKNLNLGPCTCQEGDKVYNPFSALKAIVQNNEEV